MHSKAGILLLLPLLAVGVVSFVIVRSQQGQGAALVASQRHAEALTPTKVAEIVRAAPESAHGATGLRGICVPRGSGELHNPWHCAIGYPDGKVVEYRVIIRANGSYTGDQQVIRYRGRTSPGSAQITGCCVEVP